MKDRLNLAAVSTKNELHNEISFYRLISITQVKNNTVYNCHNRSRVWYQLTIPRHYLE